LKASPGGLSTGQISPPDTPAAERVDYGEVVLARRLSDAFVRLNPELPVTALDDAFRKPTHPEGPTLEGCNYSL